MADVKKINGYNIKDETARNNLNTHTGNTTVHITSSERTLWTDSSLTTAEINEFNSRLGIS